jgi:hypothetical protein
MATLRQHLGTETGGATGKDDFKVKAVGALRPQKFPGSCRDVRRPAFALDHRNGGSVK